MIEVRNLTKKYDNGNVIFRDLNVTIHDGDVIAVIGPSGCGKSTFLFCLNMLHPATSGSILVDGEDIMAPGCDLGRVRRKIGTVFQSFNLFENMSVIENIMHPQIHLLNRSPQEACDKAMELLRSVGMAQKAMSYPDELSGGQKQRVAIARTLAMEPEVILFDEPTSALDPTMVGEVESVIRNLAGSGVTMLIVTHEMRFAKEISNRVFFMKGGLYDDGTPEEIFDHPQKTETRRFIQKLKVFEYVLQGKDFDYPQLSAALEGFTQKNLLTKSTNRKLRSIVEEVLENYLVPVMDESTRVRIEAEYHEKDHLLGIGFRYDGEKLDLSERIRTDEDIAAVMIRACYDECDYAYEEGAVLPNVLSFRCS